MTSNEFIDRLWKVIKELAGKQNKFALLIGVKAPKVNKWLNPKFKYFPAEEDFKKMGDQSINLHWLLTGKGEKYLKEEISFIQEGEFAYGDDADLLSNYKQLSKEHKKDIQAILKNLLIAEDKTWQPLKKGEFIVKEKSSTYTAKKKTHGR